jgi:hypothetical protein
MRLCSKAAICIRTRSMSVTAMLRQQCVSASTLNLAALFLSAHRGCGGPISPYSSQDQTWFGKGIDKEVRENRGLYMPERSPNFP